MIWLTLTDQLPSGKSNLLTTRTGRRYPNARFTAWRKSALLELRPQLRGAQGLPYRHAVRLVVRYRPQDQRRRDVDAMLGCLGHLLERAEVLADDSLIREVDWRPPDPLITDAPCVRMLIQHARRTTP